MSCKIESRTSHFKWNKGVILRILLVTVILKHTVFQERRKHDPKIRNTSRRYPFPPQGPDVQFSSFVDNHADVDDDYNVNDEDEADLKIIINMFGAHMIMMIRSVRMTALASRNALMGCHSRLIWPAPSLWSSFSAALSSS